MNKADGVIEFAPLLRIVFNCLYGILDKIAFFVNHYHDLGMKDSSIRFQTIWQQKKLEGLKSKNMRALFAISLDLYKQSNGLSLSPETRELLEIRNQIAHKHFLTYHGQTHPDIEFGYACQYDAFKDKSLRMLRLARDSIIYLWSHVQDIEYAEARSKGAP